MNEKLKNPIPGFVGALPGPGSILYPASDIEEMICAHAIVYAHLDSVPRLMELGVSTEKFVNPIWAKLWEIVVELWEGGNVELLQASCGYGFAEWLRTQGYEGLFGHQCHQVLLLWAKPILELESNVWALMMVKRYRDEAAKEKMRLASEALDKGDDDAGKQALTEGIEVIDETLDREKEVEGVRDVVLDIVQEFEAIDAGEIIEKRTFPTGIEHIDRLTKGGASAGDLFVFGAHTGKGKSVLMLQAAGNAAREGATVLVVSMEMSKRENLARIITAHLGGNHNVLVKDPASLSKEEKGHYQGAFAKLLQKEWKIHVTEKGTQTIESLRQMCRRYRPDVLVVDYIGLLQGGEGHSREERYSWFSGRLKALAKDFGCSVLTACQLNADGKIYGAKAIAHDGTLVVTVDEEEGLFVDKVRHSAKPDEALPYFLNGEKQRFEYQSRL